MAEHDKRAEDHQANQRATINGEICKTVKLYVEVQENGIIRDDKGWIIGRANDEWMRYNWRMLESGVCPCCGREVPVE